MTTILHRLSAAAILLAGTAIVPACQNNPSVSPQLAQGTPSQQVVAGAAVAAPGAVDLAVTVYPKSLAAVNTVCPIVQNTLSALASCLSGGAAGATGAVSQASNIVNPSCTEAGRLDLANNDAKAAVTGPSVSNSGDSAAFLLKITSDAAAAAPIACPIARALLSAAK